MSPSFITRKRHQTRDGSVTRSLDPTGRGRARWVIRWKAALNAFAITFDGRINPSINQDAR
jgi:hypothetical protein